MNKMWNWILKQKIILLILLLAFFLRIYDIDNNPKSMYGDELTLVYDAYSLLKTGQDQKGESWPLFFSMGGGRPAGYIYATIPFTAIFGPTALAARFVSVLSGAGIVFLIYLITSIIISKRVGIFSSLLAAITPWELSLSRGGFESHLALFFGLLGFYLFLIASKKNVFYILSALSFALAMQTYLTYVLTIPFIVLLIAYSYRKTIFSQKKQFKIYILFLSLLILLGSLSFSLYTSLSRGSKDRFSNLYIFNQLDLQAQVSEKVGKERNFTPLNSELAARIHNRYLEFANIFFQNYLQNFGLDFLILKGDQNPRHNPPHTGEIFWAGLPLAALGIIFLFNKFKDTFKLVSGWILLAPIAGSLVGSPHAIRSSFLLPPLIILMGSGLAFIINLKKPGIRGFKIFLLILFLIQLPIFLYRFYLLSPNLNASFWSYSAKEATQYALENKNKYKYIILSTSIPDLEFAFIVYGKIDPKDTIYQNFHKTSIDEFKFLKYDNIYLGSIPSTRIKQAINSLAGSVLYLGVIQDRGLVDNERTVNDKNNNPLFVVSTKE